MGQNLNSKELRNMILAFIKDSSNGRTSQEINNYIYPKMDGDMIFKNNKTRTSLTYLRKKGLIKNKNTYKKPVWFVK